ncbi:MAG: hypothetical protein LBJ67_03470 [Planctomycetaceae bacterium]|nr:hypothetical protein [Planctomycetaceae bacterium]
MVNARLIRYADDFVVMAGNVSDSLQNRVVTKIESRMGARKRNGMSLAYSMLTSLAPSCTGGYA